MHAPPVTIAFVGGRRSGGSHYASIRATAPANVRIEVERLSLWHERDPEGNQPSLPQSYVNEGLALAHTRGWNAMALTGAPNQILYPDAGRQIQELAPIPVTTALESSIAALRALSVRRPLILTPFEDDLNQQIRASLSAAGVDAILPRRTFATIEAAAALDANAVIELASTELAAAPDADGIYFQGARLDPIPVLEQLERDLGTTIVASNPAMMWHMLSKIQQSFSIEGFGRLLREWPLPV